MKIFEDFLKEMSFFGVIGLEPFKEVSERSERKHLKPQAKLDPAGNKSLALSYSQDLETFEGLYIIQ